MIMGKTESYDFVYKKIYRLESHPELTLIGRLSDKAGTPFNTKNAISYLFLGLLNKNHIFSHLTLTLMFLNLKMTFNRQNCFRN